MATQCNDIETLLPTYLDGELDPHDRLSLEHHVADCAECRERVRAEAAHQARVRELLAAPPSPEGLADRVRESLDSEDRRARALLRQMGRSWALPGAAGLAAAAALVAFGVAQLDSPERAVGEARVARSTTSGPRIAATGRGESSSMGMRVSMPTFSPPEATSDATRDGADPWATWRPTQALFDVRLVDGSHYQVRMELLSCRNVDLRGHQKWMVGEIELWGTAGAAGAVNRVIMNGNTNTCMVFASDMELRQLVKEVSRGLR